MQQQIIVVIAALLMAGIAVTAKAEMPKVVKDSVCGNADSKGVQTCKINYEDGESLIVQMKDGVTVWSDKKAN